MGTLGGFPNPPAHWLRRAKLGSAYADDGNQERCSQALPHADVKANAACVLYNPPSV
jgi:hypothetical protein